MFNPTQIKNGHRRLFYGFIFVISLFLISVSAYDVETREFGSNIYTTILRDLGIALLIIVFLYVLKRLSFLNEETEETLHKVNSNSEILTKIETSTVEALNFSKKHLPQENIGYSYTQRNNYYKEYYDLIINSTKTVKLIGDGFRCHNAKNENRALGLYNAIRSATKNDVVVSRFQYHNTLSIKWLNLLLNLMESDLTREKIRLYMDKNRDPTTLPYVICLTDQGLCNASVNVMFTMNADTSKLEEKLGGPAFIFENAKDSTSNMDKAVSDYFSKSSEKSRHDIKKIIEDLIKYREGLVSDYIFQNNITEHNYATIMKISKETEVPDTEIIDRVLAEKIGITRELYFSFGSNLTDDRIRVEERAPSAICIDRGFIEDYEMCFNIKGSKDGGEGGGIANIRPYKGRRVYGAVYLIDRSDFERLEEREISMGYSTETMTVDKQGFGKINAKLFISKTKSKRHIPPNIEYAKFISQGMVAQYFPQTYINGINKLMEIKP